MATIISNLATTNTQNPTSLLATAQRIALSKENAAKRLSYTKPRSHLATPPNINLAAPKRNLRPIIVTTLIPLNIEKKEMRRNSQKHFGMLKILAMRHRVVNGPTSSGPNPKI